MTMREYLDRYAQAHRHPINRLCHSLGIPCIIASLIWLGTLYLGAFANSSSAVRGPWILFAVGWLFQFIGHAVERSLPEFLKNPIYLVIGPIYFFDKLFRKHKQS
jgi:uncharacterized membrane protein YGL010W